MWSPSFSVLILGLLVAKLLQQHSLVQDCAQAGHLHPPLVIACSQQSANMQLERISRHEESRFDRVNMHLQDNEDDYSPPTSTTDELRIRQREQGASFHAQFPHHEVTSSAPQHHQSSS